MSMKTRWKLILCIFKDVRLKFQNGLRPTCKKGQFWFFSAGVVWCTKRRKRQQHFDTKEISFFFFLKSEHGYEENNSHNASARDTPLAQPKQTLARTPTHTKGQVQKGKKTLVNLLLKHKARSRGKRGVRRKTCVNVHTHTHSHLSFDSQKFWLSFQWSLWNRKKNLILMMCARWENARQQTHLGLNASTTEASGRKTFQWGWLVASPMLVGFLHRQMALLCMWICLSSAVHA